MLSYQYVKSVYLSHIYFQFGLWSGSFHVVFTYKEKDHLLPVTFTYEYGWKIESFKYPITLSDKERDVIRREFLDSFKSLSKEFESLIFLQREKYYPRPHVLEFQIDENLSDKNIILGTFTVENISDVFYANIQLVNNEWIYKLSTKNDSITNHKTFLGWEDSIFEQLITFIEKHPKFRLRYVMHESRFRHKK